MIFPEPLVTAFRRFKNLKGMLVRARLTDDKKMQGCYLFVKCLDVECANIRLILIHYTLIILIRNIRLIFCLTMIRLMLYIYLTVWYVVSVCR